MREHGAQLSIRLRLLQGNPLNEFFNLPIILQQQSLRLTGLLDQPG
jgi:hypothetical protein